MLAPGFMNSVYWAWVWKNNILLKKKVYEKKIVTAKVATKTETIILRINILTWVTQTTSNLL